MSFSAAQIADAVEEGLRAEAARLDAEQAVRGIDALDELSLHPILARSLAAAGFGVHPEERFPADRVRLRRTEGERCDLVLTPPGRGALAAPERAPTLFDPADPLPLEEAFWLEVKSVSQFALQGANAGYASALLAAVREDAAKLALDPGINHAGLLVVLCCADERVAAHDLDVAVARALESGLPLGSPHRRAFPIADRHGNGVCAIGLVPVKNEAASAGSSRR